MSPGDYIAKLLILLLRLGAFVLSTLSASRYTPFPYSSHPIKSSILESGHCCFLQAQVLDTTVVAINQEESSRISGHCLGDYHNIADHLRMLSS